MADSQDDEFDDLFSFGVEAPSTTSTAPPASLSDFDLLADLNTAPAPAPASAAGDEFDDLFGTPPGTPITPKTPMDATTGQDSLPSPDLINAKQSIDDFHMHDAGTRDFLEWLDDDDKHKDSNSGAAGLLDVSGEDNVKSSSADDDDFDFDQMLAEADVSSSLKSSQQTTSSFKNSQHSAEDSVISAVQQVEQVQQTNLVTKEDACSTLENPAADNPNFTPPDAPSDPTVAEPTIIESRNSQLSTGTVTPEPISKPYVSACIEEELAFESWNDDADDFQIVTAAEGGNTSNTEIEASDAASLETPKSVSSTSSPTKATFTTLSEAIRSNTATIDDLRSLFKREKGRSNNSFISLEDRPYLWTKVICGKVLGELDNGSLADSFREWQKKNTNEKYAGKDCISLIEHMLKEVGSSAGTDEDLLSVLAFYDNDSKECNDLPESIDTLLPPVALAILQSGIPPAAASVVLSQIAPSSMPLLRLPQSERYLAVKNLHRDFYLLACYHLPLLVMHLDRQCPGWYWPKPLAQEDSERELNSQTDGSQNEGKTPSTKQDPEEHGGLVPLSWFITNFAGELGMSCLDHKVLLPLWDYLLTFGDCSIKFFLAIAILDRHSDSLLMSRGEELKTELEKLLNFKGTSFDEESFVGTEMSGVQSNSCRTNTEMVSEWLYLAQSLTESTPSSVINMLRSVDDRAVASALTARKTALDAKTKAQIEAEEAAKKKEREERDAEAKKAMMKARLVSYYREHNPEKVDTIDQIYNMFDGRFEVLNEKLNKKYGKGFLPDDPVKDQVSIQTRHFLESVNKSISETRKHVAMSVADRRKKISKTSSTEQTKSKVALEVSPTEIIPHICSTKGHNPVTGEKWSTSVATESDLKFYLIDCRPESTAKEQGRFPTAVNMGPDKLQDPDELQQLTDMFESLRGAVHICVMGEGFSSFPALYDHPLTHEEEKLLEDDISRTSNCWLFFVKKGFPFVSTLKGGFAAAHAFLWRQGPDLGLTPSNVLIDYDPIMSLFAQLETSHQEQEEYKNAPAREKTARTLQKIIDSSMTRLTLEEQRLNGLASDLTRPENVDKMKQSMRTFSQKVSSTGISFGKTPPLFMTKKFSTSKPAKLSDEGLSKDESSKLSSLASFKDKMAFKSWQSESTETSNTVKDAPRLSANEGEPAVEAETTEVDEAQGKSALKAEDKDDRISDSLRTLSINSSTQEEESIESSNAIQFSSMSQFRLKMGFSKAKAVEDNVAEIKPVASDECENTGDTSQLKNAFGFLKKQPVVQSSKIADDMACQNMATATPDAQAEVESSRAKNPFGFLKKPSAPVNEGASTSEGVKIKFASITKSFGTSLLHKKEAPEENKNAGNKEEDLKQSSPSSPVKVTYDTFSKSLEAVKSASNKLLNEISEHEDPFNPKNSRPVVTRFSRAKAGDAIGNQKINATTQSLILMEDDPDDDGLEDVIDFGTGTDSETTEELPDPFIDTAQTNSTPPNDLLSSLNPQPEKDSENLSGDMLGEESGPEKAEL